MSDSERERIEALLKAATAESATELATLEQQTDSKELRKAARRALYLLSIRGIRPIPVVLSGETLPDVAKPETLRAYATSCDGVGSRVLFLEIAEPDGGKPTAAQIMINDVTGLQTFDSARLTRRDLRQRVQQLEQLQADGLAFAEIPADYGRWLLGESRELLRRQNKPSPPGVLELLPRIGVARHDYLVSPIYDSISAQNLDTDTTIAREPDALFALPWFENWFFAVEDVLRALEDWERLADPSQITSVEDADAQREVLLGDLTSELFTPGVRTRYVRRLEETADILWRLSHEADAKLALSHAQVLAADGPVSEVPFARTMVERTLVAGVAMMQEQRAGQAQQE